VKASARRPGGRLFEARKRLLLDADDRDVVAGGAGGIEDQKRKPSVSSDETKFHGFAVANTNKPRRHDVTTKSSYLFVSFVSSVLTAGGTISSSDLSIIRPRALLRRGGWPGAG
jgi:hypothetical protein